MRHKGKEKQICNHGYLNELSKARHRTVVRANVNSAQTEGGAARFVDCTNP